MASVWVYENTWPTWSEPLTVGGGVSMENTSSRRAVSLKRYVPSFSHCWVHFASRPSSAGFSGKDSLAGSRVVRARGDESDISESYTSSEGSELLGGEPLNDFGRCP